MPQNTNPFEPWNRYDSDNPFLPHNGMDKNDPRKPWNNPLGTADDLSDRERSEYGLPPKKGYYNKDDDE